MREAFAHDAVVELAGDGDEALAGPGAAITLRLCGSWDHAGPCPLSPHHTAAERVAGHDFRARLRILFAAHPEDEALVRREIDAALATGGVTDPEGVARHWRLVDSYVSAVRPEERDHGQRLVGS